MKHLSGEILSEFVAFTKIAASPVAPTAAPALPKPISGTTKAFTSASGSSGAGGTIAVGTGPALPASNYPSRATALPTTPDKAPITNANLTQPSRASTLAAARGPAGATNTSLHTGTSRALESAYSRNTAPVTNATVQNYQPRNEVTPQQSLRIQQVNAIMDKMLGPRS